MSKPLTFVLNDETKVNSYGFSVFNADLSLDRFKNNSVLLVQHYNDVMNVVGRVANLRVDGSRLLGDLEFDLEDEQAAKLAGKVERGFIKGVSIGLIFSREDMVQSPNGAYTLNASELMEVSLVAVPSNANAIRLFAASGELLTDTEVKLSISQLQTQFRSDKINNMEKIILSATALVALGLTVNPENGNEISAAVEKLTGKLTEANLAAKTAKDELAAVKASVALAAKESVALKVKQAIVEGKLTADQETEMVQLGVDNPKVLDILIGRLPAKTDLAGKVINAQNLSDGPKDLAEFEKMPVVKQLAFKTDNPDGYKALFSK